MVDASSGERHVDLKTLGDNGRGDHLDLCFGIHFFVECFSGIVGFENYINFLQVKIVLSQILIIIIYLNIKKSFQLNKPLVIYNVFDRTKITNFFSVQRNLPAPPRRNTPTPPTLSRASPVSNLSNNNDDYDNKELPPPPPQRDYSDSNSAKPFYI